MKPLLHGVAYLTIIILFALNAMLSGCGEAIETQSTSPQTDSLVASLQADNQRLQDENAQLKKSNAQLDQDKKALNAKVADLTSKLGQSSSQWQDLQDLQVRVNTLDSELAVQKQINRDLSAKSAEVEKPSTEPASTVTTSADYKKAYDQSLKLYNGKKYPQAIAKLQDLSRSTVNNPLVSNVHFWLGECYYATKDYAGAVKEFQKTISYPKSNKEADAYVMLGTSYLKLGDKDNAKATWETLVNKLPNSEPATRARNYLKQL